MIENLHVSTLVLYYTTARRCNYNKRARNSGCMPRGAPARLACQMCVHIFMLCILNTVCDNQMAAALMPCTLSTVRGARPHVLLHSRVSRIAAIVH
jgi:hypothetical protein